MADRRDYVALEWVKGEIDETLQQARYALEAYSQAPDDINRLEFSLSYIHQVYGTLQMVEFFGAALLAEEMEKLNQAMVNGTVPANNDNLAVLMQAIIQLPNYLEQLTAGQLDLPIVVLPLLNDIRAARGEGLLSETSLFSPDMSAAYKLVGEPDYSQITKPQTIQLVRKLRQMFQLAMLSFLKGESQEDSLVYMVKAIGRMVTLTERCKNAAIWRVADAFVLALKHKHISRSPAVVEVLREIDHSFKSLLKSPLEAAQSFPSEAQLKHLLFYLAKLGDTGVSRITQVQTQFRLEDALPDEHEVQVQRARLSGPDRATVTSVVVALLEELARLKDALDLMVRTNDTEAAHLQELLPPLQQLADTMAVIGLGNPRRVLGEQIELIKSVAGQQGIDNGLLMDVAGALLYVEATLSGIVDDASQGLNGGTTTGISTVHNAVLREARNGIELVKDAIVEYIGSHFDSVILSRAPAILAEVRGGLLMVPLHDVSRILEAVQQYIQSRLINERYRPDWSEMDALADALVGVEYYLERISRDGSSTNTTILERAAQSLNRIGVDVFLTAANEQSESRFPAEPDEDAPPVVDQVDPQQVDVPELEIIEEPLSSQPVVSNIEFDTTEWDSPESDEQTVDDVDENSDNNTQIVWDELPIAEVDESEFEQTLAISSSDFNLTESETDISRDESMTSDWNVQQSEGNNDQVALQGDGSTQADAPVESSFAAPDTSVDANTDSTAMSAEEDDLIDEEILEIFTEEVSEVLEDIHRALPLYKADPSDQNSLSELRRAFHTLKGSGRMVGADVIGETAWSIENMLNKLIDGSVHHSDDLLRVIEEVTQLVPTLMSAFENKLKPDSTKADDLAAKAGAIANGEAVFWTEPDALLSEVSPLEPTGFDSYEQEGFWEETLDFSELPIAEVDELANADVDDALQRVFQTELSSHLEFVDNYLADEPFGERLPDALQRALHTIRGSAHTASMEVIAEAVAPVESLVKDLQEQASSADSSFISVLSDLRALIHSYASSAPGADIPDGVRSFIARVEALRGSLNAAKEGQVGQDTSLMTIFLSESMDIVMDAESMLEQWRSDGQASSAAETLIRELDTLAQAAMSVDLVPVSQLSNELRSLYMAAESNPYLIEEKFFTLAHDGHEALISMMDRLAAGQSIRTDAMFSERLKQLFDVYGVAYQVNSEAPQAIDEEPQYDPFFAQSEPPQYQSDDQQQEPSLETTPIVSSSFTEDAQRFAVSGDPDLVEIFIEEANDTLESIQASLDNWLIDPENSVEVESLQRDLHTLKGGARMAEIQPLGDLAHELEYLYEGLGHRQYVLSDPLVKLLQQCHDRIASMLGDIESNMSCLSAPDLVDAISNFRRHPSAPILIGSQPLVASSQFGSDSISDSPTEDKQTEDDAQSQAPEETDYEADNSDVEELIGADIELPEDLDFDILEIFVEEAGELLNELENAIEDWRAEPEMGAHADEMKRVLHTLKGGARLAKLASLGDRSHEFETFIIQTQQNHKPIDKVFFAEVLSRQDQLVASIEGLQNLMAEQGESGGGFGPSVIQMVAEQVDSEPEQPAEPQGEYYPPQPIDDASNADPSANVLPFKAKPQALTPSQGPDSSANQVRRVQPQETVKVSANLLENLVNLAGETSISRARLEQEVSDFGYTLTDMDQTIDRLRDHVRRLDLETEAQIAFRQERAEETNYEDFDPLEMDRYSQIQQLSRSLMEATYDLQDLKSTLNDKTRDAETILLQQSRINTELQEGLMRTRMVPFNRLLPRLRRIVRQVATELGKEVDFIVGNDEGEVDRTVLERMISPLEHLLRNAVDHGIESPDVRQQVGKNTKGVITIDLSREGGDIVLRLEDDGKGIDVQGIRKKAIERGLMTQDSVLNDNEIMQFILEAGFSTAEKVTQISGRGVGMDVVNSEVKQLGGSISIDSDYGFGSVFVIRLPFTVSVNRALMVNTADDLYALPLTSIEGIVRITPKQLAEYYKPNAPMFEYGGSRYRLEHMGTLLRTSGRPSLAGIDTPVPLILVRGSDDKHSMALHVDRLLGSREIVVKTLGSQFSRVPGVSGATILGDGSVVIILDLSALIRSDLVIEHHNTTAAIGSMPTEQSSSRRKRGPAKIMVCDDSVTVRKVTSRLLERNGMEVMLAKHGVDAINQMAEVVPDLILLDIEMPNMDGFEVASRVRHDDRLKNVPIIMITSRTGSKHRERALSIGVNDYMGKPFQEGPLLQNIERLLDEL